MNSIEIDFLPVGNGERSGDSIAFRYGDFSNSNSQKIVVIDGGTLDSGKSLVNHINKFYDGNVSLAILTHPDGDHSSGLREVISDLKVNELWMHKPWDHSLFIRNLFTDGRLTDNSLSDRLKEAYSFAHEVYEAAVKKDIPIKEPFSGLESSDGVIKVLGPSIEFYRALIPEFTKSPPSKTSIEKAFAEVKEAIKWVLETMEIETLSEDGETSAENNSSAVLLLDFDSNKYMFTGDAGIEALREVIDFSRSIGQDISNLRFFQVPHHGSHRNITPSILDSIKCETAYISAAEKAPKHPSKKVVNALIRRGAKVFSTEGSGIRHNNNAPPRDGYGPIAPLAFSNQVEE